jgi:hypothetical protein
MDLTSEMFFVLPQSPLSLAGEVFAMGVHKKVDAVQTD